MDEMEEFKLSPEFVSLLGSIRENYIEIKGTTPLTETPQPFAIARFFGAPDIENRNKQITFIENWLELLDKDLHVDENDSVDGDKNLNALRILVAVIFYIKWQISTPYILRSPDSSKLGQLLDKALGLCGVNAIDEKTKACCLFAAQRFLMTETAYSAKSGEPTRRLFADEELARFRGFIDEQCKPLDNSLMARYPLTKITVPLISTPMQLAGLTIGFIMGEALANTTKLVPANAALTKALSNGLFVIMGPSAYVGATLLTPTCASRMLNIFCGSALATAMGTAGTFIGQGIGLGVGISLHLSWTLLNRTINAIYKLHEGAQEGPTGISLLDGRCFVKGMAVEFVYVPELTAEQQAAIETGMLSEGQINSEQSDYNPETNEVRISSEPKMILLQQPQGASSSILINQTYGIDCDSNYLPNSRSFEEERPLLEPSSSYQ